MAARYRAQGLVYDEQRDEWHNRALLPPIDENAGTINNAARRNRI